MNEIEYLLARAQSCRKWRGATQLSRGTETVEAWTDGRMLYRIGR